MLEKNQLDLIEAARQGDEGAFRSLIEPLSRELQVYAYRLLGGFHDAEDALQETRLRAWRGLEAHEPRASFRAWMYRIATSTCLDMLRSRQQRVFPQDVGPAVEPGPPSTAPREDVPWFDPYPDSLLPASADPESAVRLRESIRLAFVRATQVLPPRQRAALILHDVLDWSASDVAAILETSVAAVNSALQRARATVARPPASDALAEKETEAVARFVQAFETGDFDRFVSMLAEDAVLSMPPWLYWLDGREAVVATLRSPGTWEGELRSGRYRVLPTSMNGQPAALSYLRLPDRNRDPARGRAGRIGPLHRHLLDGDDPRPAGPHLRAGDLRPPRAVRRLRLPPTLGAAG